MTMYLSCDALNFSTSSLSRSPSTPLMACHHCTSTRAACAGAANAKTKNIAAMNAIFFMGGSSSAVQQVGASKSSPDHLYFYNDICVTMMKGGVPDCPPEPLVRPDGGR